MFKRWWCRHMHSPKKATWPVQGFYTCRTCWCRHKVDWNEPTPKAGALATEFLALAVQNGLVSRP